MKKFLALILGALVVFGFAASAFAIHAEIPSDTTAMVAKGGTQITLGGEIRTRAWYQKNVVVPATTTTNGLPLASDSEGWYDQRIRLAVDAVVSPNVKGRLHLESNTAAQSDVYTWGNFNSKPTSLAVLEAWIQYTGSGLLGIPAGLKIGHMPLALGEKQFFEHTKYGDDAIVFFMDPTKEAHIGLLTVKFTEGVRTANTDDTDGYVGLVTYKLDDKNTLGINYTYLNNSKFNPFMATTSQNFKMQNLGLHANGNISGLGYAASADFQFGSQLDTAGNKAKFKGYGILAKLNYKIDTVNLRGMFAYGSGDSEPTKGDIKEFITFLGNDQHYTLAYEYKVSTAATINNMLGNNIGVSTGIANTTVYNLGVDFGIAKDMKAAIDGYLLYASKTPAGVDKELGWEVDGRFVYNFAKNLAYQFDIGYFDANDFYGPNAKGVTVIRQVLTLNF